MKCTIKTGMHCLVFLFTHPRKRRGWFASMQWLYFTPGVFLLMLTWFRDSQTNIENIFDLHQSSPVDAPVTQSSSEWLEKDDPTRRKWSREPAGGGLLSASEKPQSCRFSAQPRPWQSIITSASMINTWKHQSVHWSTSGLWHQLSRLLRTRQSSSEEAVIGAHGWAFP